MNRDPPLPSSPLPHPSGIPSALHEAGFGTGVVLLTLVALITDYTVLLLIKDGIMAGKFSYQVGGALMTSPTV